MILISMVLLRNIVFILSRILQHEHIAIYLVEQDTDFSSVPHALLSTTLYLGELSSKESHVVISPSRCGNKFSALQHRVLLSPLLNGVANELLTLWASLVVVSSGGDEFSGKHGFPRTSM